MDEQDDPLAQFRGMPEITEISRSASKHFGPSVFQKISQSASPDQMAGDPHHYAAFGQGGRNQVRLEIRRLLGEWHAPSYRYLMDIVFDGRYGTEIVLVFSFLLVKIRGKNLQPVMAVIAEETCAYIQDYDAREFSPPAPDAPVITKIEVVVRGEKEK